MEDLFFNEKFGRLYEELREGICDVFEIHNSKGKIRHVFIKREIPVKIDGKTYYDLITPQEYGGPIITMCEEKDKQELIYEFTIAFASYCKDNFIIYEHIRFHPLAKNAEDFAEYYETEYIGETYGTNLRSFIEPIPEEFSTSCLKTIWRAIKAGVQYRIAAEPANLTNFVSFYSKHVNKDEIGLKNLLESCKLFKEHLVIVEAVHEEQIIGMSLSFLSKEVLHTHVSVVHPLFNSLSPAHIMHFGLAVWGKENQIPLIHNSGKIVINGQMHDLPMFKQQFSNNTIFQHWSGRRIWDEEADQKLCKVVEIKNCKDNYPIYRFKQCNSI